MDKQTKTLGAIAGVILAITAVVALAQGGVAECNSKKARGALFEALIPVGLPNRNNIRISLFATLEVGEGENVRECKSMMRVTNTRTGQKADSRWEYSLQNTQDNYTLVHAKPLDEEAFLWLMVINSFEE